MKVYIVGSRGGCEYAQMYQLKGHTIVSNIMEADLVQFTGGSDVSPEMYGEEPHPKTSFSATRDRYDVEAYQKALRQGTPMVGICRGGQFLNVMNGGKMYQHVDNHAIHGTHLAFDVHTDKEVQVTSTHHQMMRPTSKAIILCIAWLSTQKEHMVDKHVNPEPRWASDIEAVYYEGTKCLCFQPHPEFNRLAVGDTRDYFFELLERYVGDVEPTDEEMNEMNLSEILGGGGLPL